MTKDLIYFRDIKPHPEHNSSGVAIPFSVSEKTEKLLESSDWSSYNGVRERIKSVVESRGYNLITVEWDKKYIVALREVE